jgi:hypothetical protein
MTTSPRPVLDYRRVAPTVRLPRYLGLRAPVRRRVNALFLTMMFAVLGLLVVVMVMRLG